LHDAVAVWSFDVNKSMRIAKIEFHDLAGEFDFLLAVICCCDRMVCIGHHTEQQRDGDC
jgi:hypothetical protein